MQNKTLLLNLAALDPSLLTECLEAVEVVKFSERSGQQSWNVLLQMKSDSSRNSFRFSAVSVDCSEAIDWEIVRVTFDTEMPDFNEEGRVTPFVSVSANFEFGNNIQMEFHDGTDYHGTNIKEVKLWRDLAVVLTTCGNKFYIDFELSNGAFRELNKYLKVLLRSDPLQQGDPA